MADELLEVLDEEEESREKRGQAASVPHERRAEAARVAAGEEDMDEAIVFSTYI